MNLPPRESPRIWVLCSLPRNLAVINGLPCNCEERNRVEKLKFRLAHRPRTVADLQGRGSSRQHDECQRDRPPSDDGLMMDFGRPYYLSSVERRSVAAVEILEDCS